MDWRCLILLLVLLINVCADSSGVDYDAVVEADAASDHSKRPKTLTFVKPLKNLTREEGEFLRLRCEVTGQPPATEFSWLKHGAPLEEERNRVKVKTRLKDNPQSTQLRFRELETLDTAFYSCVASNGLDSIESQAIIKVEMSSGQKRRPVGGWGDDDDDYDGGGRYLPESYSEPDFSGNVEFEGGQKPPERKNPSNSNSDLSQGIPNLKPDARAGQCQPYLGKVCGKYVGNDYVFVSEGLSQEYIEQKLSAAFAVISASPDLSSACSPYAIPSICLSTFPLCDRVSERPRKLCREECELLEHRLCRKELAIARQYAALERQLVLPECTEMPAVGSPESAGCVRLGVPDAAGLVRPHSCYRGSGGGYRGTVSTTSTGLMCMPWNKHPLVKTEEHLELIGGHNFCRAPTGGVFYENSLDGQRDIDGPWCYVSASGQTFREVCGIPRCNHLNFYLYVGVPTLVSVAFLGLCLGICCMRRRNSGKDAKPAAAADNPPVNAGQVQPHQNAANMEMNSLLPPQPQQQIHFQQQQQQPLQQQQVPQRQVQLREFPISSVRFMEELGEGGGKMTFHYCMFAFTGIICGITFQALLAKCTKAS